MSTTSVKTGRDDIMSIRSVTSEKAPRASGPYSQAIIVRDLVITSGQIPVNPETGEIPSTIEEQTKRTLDNLTEVLNSAGADRSDVVSTRIFLSDMKNFAVVNFIYMEYFKEPYPARTCVEVSALPKGVMIMIDCMASLTD